jgi:glycosyltransferase involved in cell wall biosynthesis
MLIWSELDLEYIDGPIREVSVIVAVKNEEDYIHKCLDSLITQSFPQEKYEIIIIDGMSDDKTREIEAEYKTKFPNLVRLFDNPEGITSSGLNIGIKNAEGKIVVTFSGHAYAHTLFLSQLIETLNNARPEVAGVGSNHLPAEDEGPLGKVIAYVQDSILGGLGTSYRRRNRRYVNSIAFCAYRKEILEDIKFDTRFGALDLELNWRIKKAGFKLMIRNDVAVYYYRRYNTFKKFAKKMISYGIWRAMVTKEHPDSFSILISLPVILILSTTSLPLVICYHSQLANVILLGLGVYLFAIMMSSLYISFKLKSIKYSMAAALIFVLEHFGYGFGFIIGLFSRLPRR